MFRTLVVVFALAAGATHAQGVHHDSRSGASDQVRADEPKADAPPSIPSAVQKDIHSVSRALETLSAKKKPDEDSAKRAADAAEQAAYWAFWMVVVAGVETFVTALGVLLVGFTLKATWAAKDEAKRAADAAEGTLQETRDNTRLELRAYLSVEPGGINYTDTPGHCMGHIVVRNVGKLPASNVFVEAHIKMGPRDMPQPGVAVDPKVVPRVIQPGALMRQGTKEIDSPIPDIVLGHAFVWGVVYYDDGYSRRRFTRFCHRYHPRSRTIYPFRSIHDVPPREVISPEEGRYHEKGNDAD